MYTLNENFVLVVAAKDTKPNFSALRQRRKMCKVSISVAFRELKNFGIPPGSILFFTRYLVWVCGDCSASSVKVKSTPLSMKDTHLDIYHPVRPFFKWWDKTLYPHYFQNVWATRKMLYHLPATRIKKILSTASLVRLKNFHFEHKPWRKSVKIFLKEICYIFVIFFGPRDNGDENRDRDCK